MIELAPGWITVIIFAGILLLMLTGMRIAFAIMIVGLFSLYFFPTRPMLYAAPEAVWGVLNKFSLTATMLFIMMGEFLMRGGIGEDVYHTLDKWLYRLPGGLAQVNIGACTIFAAVSGSSIANSATMGVVAAPIMESRGYNTKLTYGSIAGGGTLGILIPPSVIMIIYGALAEVSVGKLFIAGIIPGIILAFLFMTFIGIWAMKSPEIAPRPTSSFSWKDRIVSMAYLLPVILLILAILGGIYGGIATPTEAAAVGCVVSLGIITARRRFTWELLKKSVMETFLIIGTMHMVVAGASMVGFVFHYLRIPVHFSESIAQMGLSPLMIYFVICGMYLLLGMFIDGISILVITIPIVVPVMSNLGFDPVWIGIILTIVIELALITPPVGMNLYVLRSVSKEVGLAEIALGAAPYAGLLLLMLVLLGFFPQLALWLPGQMFGG